MRCIGYKTLLSRHRLVEAVHQTIDRVYDRDNFHRGMAPFNRTQIEMGTGCNFTAQVLQGLEPFAYSKPYGYRSRQYEQELRKHEGGKDLVCEYLAFIQGFSGLDQKRTIRPALWR